MSFIKNIPLRPHHGMCLAYFKGEGYSNGFSAHMQEMLDIFQKGAKIQLHADTDEICSACPNNEKGCCSSFSLVEAYDNAVLELCGLENGQIMEFDDFTDVVQRKSWHQERGKKSVGIVSGTPSVKVRRADGRNAKKNRVTE